MSLGSAWAADATEVQRVGTLQWSSQSTEGEPLWECVKSALMARQGRSLIIFDWDDTLFPTTELEVSGLMDNPHLAPWEELAELQAAAIRVLRSARSIGTTLIVTNSDHGWVHETAAKFFPGLA